MTALEEERAEEFCRGCAMRHSIRPGPMSLSPGEVWCSDLGHEDPDPTQCRYAETFRESLDEARR